jgi:hypothetical protein
MNITNILKVVPMIQTASILNENVKVMNKKKVNTKDIVKLGVTNVVGIGLIQAENQFINSI